MDWKNIEENKKRGGDGKMIVFIALVIAGFISLAVNITAYHKRGGVSDYWSDLIERYEIAWPIVKFNGGVN